METSGLTVLDIVYILHFFANLSLVIITLADLLVGFIGIVVCSDVILSLRQYN